MIRALGGGISAEQRGQGLDTPRIGIVGFGFGQTEVLLESAGKEREAILFHESVKVAAGRCEDFHHPGVVHQHAFGVPRR